MYEVFFGLKEKPFSLLPDPDFLFLSSKHALALSMLEYSLAGQAGFCVISGEIGSGKTTLIRALLRKIGRDTSIGLISNTHSTHTDIAGWALTAFGQRPTGQTTADRYQELMHYLIAEYGAGRRCVLIVDEAQNLTIEALEELRLLSNINSGKDLLLQIILVGQPELLHKLKSPELYQFAQRISVSHHLAPLSSEETNKYVQYRLQVAGAERPIFTPMAIGGVYYFSGGVPRLINAICDMSLVYAFADGKQEIDLDTVFRVVGDRQSSGITAFSQPIPADIDAAVAEISKLVGLGAERPGPKGRVEPTLRHEPRRTEVGLIDDGGHELGGHRHGGHEHGGHEYGAAANGTAAPEMHTAIRPATKPSATNRREPKLHSARRQEEPQLSPSQDSQVNADGLPRLTVARTTDGRLIKRVDADEARAMDASRDRRNGEERWEIRLSEGDYRSPEKSDEAEAARLRSWFRRTFMRSS